MAPNASDDTVTAGEEADRPAHHRALRYVVPVTVIGVAVATIGLVPAIADSGDPDLPKITAKQLLDKIAASDAQQLSGTVKITTDLGLTNLGGLESSLLSGVTGSGEGDGSSADPSSKLIELASGTHTLRVAADGPDRQKASLVDGADEYSVIHNGKDLWGYDSASNEVYHSRADGDSKDDESPEGRDKAEDEQPSTTPKDLTEDILDAADDTTSVTVDGTVHVAGRDAYRLLIKPKQSGSTVGAVSVAVDAKTGLPLKFTLTPASGGAAVVDVGFTRIRFAEPAASTFDFTPPKDAKVTEGDDEGKESKESKDSKGSKGSKESDRIRVTGEGWSSIAVFETGDDGSSSGDGGSLSGVLDSFGDKVSGNFGSGTVYSTRVINALITDDGTVYVGAVTKDALLKAADSGK